MIFKQKWIESQLKLLKIRFPKFDDDYLTTFLSDEFDNNVNDRKIIIDNNYTHKRAYMTITKLLDYIYIEKPIIAGNGTLFKPHHEVYNPFGKVIRSFSETRKEYKKLLKVYTPGSFEYLMADLRQLIEKVNNNAFYGASGTPIFFAYNIYVASATTQTGQTLITMAITTFENFMKNSVKFNNIDEIYTYISNCLDDFNDIGKVIPKWMTRKSKSKLLKILKLKSIGWNDSINESLQTFLDMLSEDEITYIFYKNNLYDFCKLPAPLQIINRIATNNIPFTNPNDVPIELSDDIDELYKLIYDYSFYRHPIFERIQRCKVDTRSATVASDTDSMMLHVGPWLDFTKENLGNEYYDNLSSTEKDDFENRSINTICTILTYSIKAILKAYAISVNIPEEYHKYLNMKNEFLFKVMLLSDTKKRYITLTKLREGVVLDPPILDIKGHDIKKSTTLPETEKFYMNLIRDNLLDVNNIDLTEIYKKLMEFEIQIRENLKSGKKDFLIPKSVKDFSSYNKTQLYREQGVRAILAWNTVYPNMTITLPAKIDIIKLKIYKLQDIDKLKESEPTIYNALKQHIFENKNPEIASKGVSVIGIPKNIPTIPEWIRDYIDYDVMVGDNLTRGSSILRTFNLSNINTKNVKYISPFISI